MIREGLEKFTGVGRRFEITRRGERRHGGGRLRAPSDGDSATLAAREIAAAASAFMCCFSRTGIRARMHLMDDFARAFHAADRVVVLDIYAASEKPIEGVTAEALVERMRAVRPSRRGVCGFERGGRGRDCRRAWNRAI